MNTSCREIEIMDMVGFSTFLGHGDEQQHQPNKCGRNMLTAPRKRDKTLQRLLRLTAKGAALGASFAFVLVSLVLVYYSESCSEQCSWEHSLHGILLRGGKIYFMGRNYVDLFGWEEEKSRIRKQTTRALVESNKYSTDSNSYSSHSYLVVAGKMTVEDDPCNIAQMDLNTRNWSLTERIQLSLYNSFSGGEVYSLLANYTTTSIARDRAEKGSGEIIVVGAFDTTYRNSQVTYCSVGQWNGIVLSKVGEGLCNVALSKGMKITTASFAGPQDVYVAGSFQTQVWNGEFHEFVKIYNIAHFNAVEQVWLPLEVGQITCSWCTVTILALAWDSKREQLHVAGKFNAIDGNNVPAGLAIYNRKTGHLVAHPGGGLTMANASEDGVATALQLDEESGVLYLMGSFERLTATGEKCHGLAAYEIVPNRWTCLADPLHTVQPTGGGNMLLTPHGLMVAGLTTNTSTWPDNKRPYTIALLKATLRKTSTKGKTPYNADDDSYDDDKLFVDEPGPRHDFNWSWLPGFDGHDEPLHALSNGFGEYEGSVFIAGDDLVAVWSYKDIDASSQDQRDERHLTSTSTHTSSRQPQQPKRLAVSEKLSEGHVHGAIMAISQMKTETVTEEPEDDTDSNSSVVGYTIVVYCVSFGAVLGVILTILCNKNLTTTVINAFNKDRQFKGISLDTLTYGAVENSHIMEAYERAMRTRYVQNPNLLTLIDPQEIFLQRIIGEGTFGRVWSAKWRSASVAVKEFVFAQAAVAGKSQMQRQIIEEIIGEAGMMAILRHPNVLQLFGCSLTAQAIWIVSELCSLGSLRQLLDDHEKQLPLEVRLDLALQVAEGMCYLHNQTPPIIHRDLKSHNIFVNETFAESEGEKTSAKKNARKQLHRAQSNGVDGSSNKAVAESTLIAKIGDWGSARATLSGSRTMTHGVGTACWLAPEVIKHARASKYSDVYGYGIVLWEMATREEVYQGLETTQIIAQVANDNLRPPVPRDCPWKSVMVRCWEENPIDRLTFDEIVDELTLLLRIAAANRMNLLEANTRGSSKKHHHNRKKTVR